MVAREIRSVLNRRSEVWVVASRYEDEGQSPEDESVNGLPFREAGASRPTPTEARAEVRDRETYYAELRFAVHCQSRSIPLPRAALDADLPKRRPDDESWDEHDRPLRRYLDLEAVGGGPDPSSGARASEPPPT
jgi:hypothetical protein